MRGEMNRMSSFFEESLSRCTDESDICHLAEEMLAASDAVAATLQYICPVPPLACRVGCDTCCHSLIQVNPVFAFLAIAQARDTMDPDRLQVLAERLASGTPFCPFLFDGACSIYAARPMVCRGYYSFDVTQCEQGECCEKSLGYQGDDAHAAHQNMIFLYVLEQRIESIENTLGLDPGPVFLDAAARILFATPESGARWLKGERLFSQHPVKVDHAG